MAFDPNEEEEEEEEESYLASYSDLVTDLMAIFVMLFSFAMMATAQQNYNIKQEMEAMKNQTQSSIVSVADQEAQQDLDMLYEVIRQKIDESNYEDDIALDRGEGYILFQFKDNVLFYPDSPVIRTDSHEILKYIGDLLVSVEDSIGTVEISGHTARVSNDSNANLVAWNLSSNRAIAVLQFFVDECYLPEAKMSVAGYAHFKPVGDNDTEEGRALNRRVEIKISRVSTS